MGSGWGEGGDGAGRRAHAVNRSGEPATPGRLSKRRTNCCIRPVTVLRCVLNELDDIWASLVRPHNSASAPHSPDMLIRTYAYARRESISAVTEKIGAREIIETSQASPTNERILSYMSDMVVHHGLRPSC